MHFPAASAQRQWLLAFLDALSANLQKELKLHQQTFLQMKSVHPDLLNDFIKNSMEFTPLFGLSRRPGAPVPPLPDTEYVDDLQKGRQAWKFGDRMADYCYWFIGRQEQKQRQLFFGYGGLTTIFIKPDPNAVPPPPRPIPPGVKRSPIFAPVFEQWNPQQGVDTAYALKSEFLQKSKEAFGKGLEEDPQYPGLLYVLPLLGTAEVMGQPDAVAKQWFEVFDVYINESLPDRGVIIAASMDLDETITGLVRSLADKGPRYPEEM
jgi:hypothetical protein